MSDKQTFLSILQSYLSIQLTEKQIQLLADYLSLLAKWNKSINLTAITDSKQMVIRHVLDSLSIASYLHGDRIIDVGTGAGLPGIPLSIMFPKKQFVLLDSQKKRIHFLIQVVAELGLENVEIVHERVEKYYPSECFETIVTRAFSSIRDILLHAQHLGCFDGIILAMKGVCPRDELDELPKGFEVKFVERLRVPDLDAIRHVVGIGKT